MNAETRSVMRGHVEAVGSLFKKGGRNLDERVWECLSRACELQEGSCLKRSRRRPLDMLCQKEQWVRRVTDLLPLFW